MVSVSTGGLGLISKYVRRVWPQVDALLAQWTGWAEAIEDEQLRRQALASLRDKRFHALGGSIYALYPGAGWEASVSFIVAFQTISDYLDNLCDRVGVTDDAAFFGLHQAMAAAVDPGCRIADYYHGYPYREDRYLSALVAACQAQVRRLPAYRAVAEPMQNFVRHYTCLQAYKHMPASVREEHLRQWAVTLQSEYPNLEWWEIAAAVGSTLGIFLLLAAAQTPDLSPAEVNELTQSYFPWVCGLHILLDYYIDAAEDRRHGDLNLVSYYSSPEQMAGRLAYFVQKSFSHTDGLCAKEFHHSVIRGLLALYLTDPKAGGAGNRRINRELWRAGGSQARLYGQICASLRQTGRL